MIDNWLDAGRSGESPRDKMLTERNWRQDPWRQHWQSPEIWQQVLAACDPMSKTESAKSAYDHQIKARSIALSLASARQKMEFRLPRPTATWVSMAFVGLIFAVLAAYYDLLDFESRANLRRLEAELSRNGSVRFSQVVTTKWEKLYIVRPYDLTQELELEIFGSPQLFLWWADIPRYWVIAFKVSERPPLLIKLRYRDWSLAREGELETTSQSASLRIIGPKDRDWERCPRREGLGKCVALSVE